LFRKRRPGGSVTLEILHFSLVLLGRGASAKSAQVAAFPVLGSALRE
jgi:hypothetical protein